MKKQLTSTEAYHAALSFFMNEIELTDSKSSTRLINKHLFLVFIPEEELPIVGKSLNEALNNAGLTSDNIPEDVYGFEFSNDGNWIRLQSCLPLEKNVDLFGITETALEQARSYFIGEILDPVKPWEKPPYIEKHCFLVMLPKNKIPFVGDTLNEAIEKTGFNLEDIPETSRAYEFRSEGSNIYFNYALPDSTYEIPTHMRNGIYNCGRSSRGLAQVIRNSNKDKQ